MSAVTTSIRPAPLPMSSNGNRDQSHNDEGDGEVQEFN